MLPNALASYYIKRGWNVWITDFGIKFGFKPGHTYTRTHAHTQSTNLMCVFSFEGRKFMKIIALDVCWNNRYGQLNTEQEHSCTNRQWAIKWRMCVKGSGVSFLLYFIMQFIIESKTHQLFMCGNVFASESISFNGSNWSYFRHYFRNNENMAV